MVAKVTNTLRERARIFSLYGYSVTCFWNTAYWNCVYVFLRTGRGHVGCIVCRAKSCVLVRAKRTLEVKFARWELIQIAGVHSAQYTTDHLVYSTQYTVHSTQRTVHSTQCTVHHRSFSIQYTVHSAQYTAHSAQYTVYTTVLVKIFVPIMPICTSKCLQSFA